MKKIFTILTLLSSFGILYAQSPSSINYQAVLRNSDGDLIKSQSISLRLSVLKGSATGGAVYTETHSTSTNEFGMVNLQIGNGSSGDQFNTIQWGSDGHYLKVELDESGGINYKSLGTSQLVSVPYAMYANTAMETINGDKDSTNEFQTITVKGNKLILSDNGGTVELPSGSGFDLDKDSLNELQKLTLSGSKLSLSEGGGTVTLPSGDKFDSDKDSLNELQKLTLFGSTLSLSNGGGSVTLPSGTGGSQWTKSGDTLSYSKFVKVGGITSISGPRMMIGATNGSGDRIGLYSRASGGNSSNHALGADMFASASGRDNNEAITIYANTGRFGANALSATMEGDSIGVGVSLDIRTLAANIGYSVNTTSPSGGGFSQYGANLVAEGAGSGNHYGIRAFGQGTGSSALSGSSNYGGVFIAGGTGKNFGIGSLNQSVSEHYINVGSYSISNGAASPGFNYAVIGSANSADTNYAAYFFGDVTYTGTLSGPSDAKLKTNVSSLQVYNTMDKIMLLNPVTYDYKIDQYDFMELPEGTQFGFIAQELREVFPELVSTQATPVFEQEGDISSEIDGGSGIDGAEIFRYQGVNYIGLIPVLTQGVQEQQMEIDSLKSDIEELKKQNAELKKMLNQLLEK